VKNKFKIFIYLMILMLVIMLLQRNTLPGSLKELFQSDTMFMQDAESIVQELRELHDLVVLTSTETVVWDSLIQNDRLVLSGKGRITAGTDLRLLMPDDVFIEGDSIAIKLPPAEIISLQPDPTSLQMLKKNGAWSPETLESAGKQLPYWLEQQALINNMPGMAEQRTREWVDNYLRMNGFEKVTLY
jgi:hypothetical protein